MRNERIMAVIVLASGVALAVTSSIARWSDETAFWAAAGLLVLLAILFSATGLLRRS